MSLCVYVYESLGCEGKGSVWSCGSTGGVEIGVGVEVVEIVEIVEVVETVEIVEVLRLHTRVCSAPIPGTLCAPCWCMRGRT